MSFPMKKFRVNFKLYFISSSKHNEVDIDEFMLETWYTSISRYLEFIYNLNKMCNGLFTSISYNNETITCTFNTQNDNITKEELSSVLKNISFENNIFSKLLTYHDGYIDYRNNITMQEL
jgi:hypothetical protein